MSSLLEKIPRMAYGCCMITPQQIRGARALVGLTQAALAKRAGLSTTGLNNIERGVADPKASTLRAIQSALEAAGVEFTDGSGIKPRRICTTPSKPLFARRPQRDENGRGRQPHTLLFSHKHLNLLCGGDSLRGWNPMNRDLCSSGRLACNCSG